MKKNFYYKLLFERVFDPISLYRVDGDNIIFIDVNPAYEKVMKLNKSDILNRDFHDVWPNAEPRWSRVIFECLKQKRTTHCIGESVDVGGFLEAIAFPIPPDMAAVIFLDRTKLKNSDNALKRKQEELRLLATQITLSEENTKRLIASDIHDRVGYELISQLNLLRELDSHHELDNYKNIIHDLISKTENIISETRELIFELSPPVLREAGLNPALEELAKNLLEHHGIKWTFKQSGSYEYFKTDYSINIILYRMARELLINVVKHSKATSVNIIINRNNQRITVAIEDNGIGFDFNKKNNGFGLFSIRERLIALGGDLRIISEPNNGTMIVMSCPLKLKNGDFI